MNQGIKNVLGISLGTRSIGMAMLAEGELIDWSIKSFRGAWSEQKKLQILDTVEQMMERYSVTAFAIKVPDKMHHFPVLESLLAEIIQLAKDKAITTATFTIQSLKAICGKDVTNKGTLRTTVLNSFSELKAEYQKESRNRNAYYTKLFEATLAAATLFQQNEEKCR